MRSEWRCYISRISCSLMSRASLTGEAKRSRSVDCSSLAAQIIPLCPGRVMVCRKPWFGQSSFTPGNPILEPVIENMMGFYYRYLGNGCGLMSRFYTSLFSLFHILVSLRSSALSFPIIPNPLLSALPPR